MFQNFGEGWRPAQLPSLRERKHRTLVVGFNGPTAFEELRKYFDQYPVDLDRDHLDRFKR